MAFVLVRDSEADQVYVYNNVTAEAAEMLLWLVGEQNGYGFFSTYKSDKPYDPAIAEEFKRTGEVSEVVAGRESVSHDICSPDTVEFDGGKGGPF